MHKKTLFTLILTTTLVATTNVSHARMCTVTEYTPCPVSNNKHPCGNGVICRTRLDANGDYKLYFHLEDQFCYVPCHQVKAYKHKH